MKVLSAEPLILVTGSTDGIGRETARELTRRGARVLVHGRDLARARLTVTELRGLGGSPPEPVVADLASFAAIRAMAAQMAADGHQPEVIIHNAGVYMKQRERTVDGFEATLAINHLAPFLLTHLVLESTVGAHLRRVVNVSSIAHNRGHIHFDDLQLLHEPYNSYASYATSKLANVLFTVELARRVGHRDITVNALHPGVASTKLLTEGFEMEGHDSLADAAATSVTLAMDPELREVTGGYFVQSKQAPPHSLADDRDIARRFYEVSAEMTGVMPLSA